MTSKEHDSHESPLKFHQVVDSQQRLTTMSILLACVADKLGPEDFARGYSPKMIRDNFLIHHNIEE